MLSNGSRCLVEAVSCGNWLLFDFWVEVGFPRFSGIGDFGAGATFDLAVKGFTDKEAHEDFFGLGKELGLLVAPMHFDFAEAATAAQIALEKATSFVERVDGKLAAFFRELVEGIIHDLAVLQLERYLAGAA